MSPREKRWQTCATSIRPPTTIASGCDLGCCHCWWRSRLATPPYWRHWPTPWETMPAAPRSRTPLHPPTRPPVLRHLRAPPLLSPAPPDAPLPPPPPTPAD